MHLTIETEVEEDGRWIADLIEIPGAMQYGKSRTEAIARAEALALRVLAERIFAFHDREEIGPRMLARIARRTGLTPEDL